MASEEASTRALQLGRREQILAEREAALWAVHRALRAREAALGETVPGSELAERRADELLAAREDALAQWAARLGALQGALERLREGLEQVSRRRAEALEVVRAPLGLALAAALGRRPSDAEVTALVEQVIGHARTGMPQALAPVAEEAPALPSVAPAAALFDSEVPTSPPPPAPPEDALEPESPPEAEDADEDDEADAAAGAHTAASEAPRAPAAPTLDYGAPERPTAGWLTPASVAADFAAPEYRAMVGLGAGDGAPAAAALEDEPLEAAAPDASGLDDLYADDVPSAAEADAQWTSSTEPPSQQPPPASDADSAAAEPALADAADEVRSLASHLDRAWAQLARYAEAPESARDGASALEDPQAPGPETEALAEEAPADALLEDAAPQDEPLAADAPAVEALHDEVPEEEPLAVEALQDAAPEDAAPEDAALALAAPEDAAPGDAQLAPEAPQDAAPADGAPEALGAVETAADVLPTLGLAPGGAPERMTPRWTAAAPSEAAADDLEIPDARRHLLGTPVADVDDADAARWLAPGATSVGSRTVTPSPLPPLELDEPPRGTLFEALSAAPSPVTSEVDADGPITDRPEPLGSFDDLFDADPRLDPWSQLGRAATSGQAALTEAATGVEALDGLAAADAPEADGPATGAGFHAMPTLNLGPIAPAHGAGASGTEAVSPVRPTTGGLGVALVASSAAEPDLDGEVPGAHADHGDDHGDDRAERAVSAGPPAALSVAPSAADAPEAPDPELAPESPAPEVPALDEPDLEVPADEPEPEVPADEPDLEVPADEPDLEVPADEPDLEVPADEPDLEVPADEPDLEVPADEPDLEVPADEPEPEVPADGPEPEVPALDEPDLDVPADEPENRVPTLDEPEPVVPTLDEPEPVVPALDEPELEVLALDEPEPEVPAPEAAAPETPAPELSAFADEVQPTALLAEVRSAWGGAFEQSPFDDAASAEALFDVALSEAPAAAARPEEAGDAAPAPQGEVDAEAAGIDGAGAADAAPAAEPETIEAAPPAEPEADARLVVDDPDTVTTLPRTFCLRHGLVPIRWQEGVLTVAIVAIPSPEVASAARRLANADALHFEQSTWSAVRSLLAEVYGAAAVSDAEPAPRGTSEGPIALDAAPDEPVSAPVPAAAAPEPAPAAAPSWAPRAGAPLPPDPSPEAALGFDDLDDSLDVALDLPSMAPHDADDFGSWVPRGEAQDASPLDPEPVEAAPVEAAPVEAEPVEAAPVEAAHPPGETADAASGHAASSEAEPFEAEPFEAEPLEAEPLEAEPFEAEPSEPEPSEADPFDAEAFEVDLADGDAFDADPGAVETLSPLADDTAAVAPPGSADAPWAQDGAAGLLRTQALPAVAVEAPRADLPLQGEPPELADSVAELELDDDSGVAVARTSAPDQPVGAFDAQAGAPNDTTQWAQVGEGALLGPPGGARVMSLPPAEVDAVERSAAPGDSVEAMSIDWNAFEGLDAGSPALALATAAAGSGLGAPALGAAEPVVPEVSAESTGDLRFDFADDDPLQSAPPLSMAPPAEVFDAALSGLLSIAPASADPDDPLAALTDDDQDPWAALDIGTDNLSPPPRLASRPSLPAVRPLQPRPPRRALTIKVGLEHQHHFFTGFTSNVGPQGMFVGTDRLLPVGSTLEVFFEVPGGSEEVSCHAEVRWTRGVDATGAGAESAGMGLRFVNLDPDARLLIDRYVRATDDPIFDG